MHAFLPFGTRPAQYPTEPHAWVLLVDPISMKCVLGDDFRHLLSIGVHNFVMFEMLRDPGIRGKVLCPRPKSAGGSLLSQES